MACFTKRRTRLHMRTWPSDLNKKKVRIVVSSFLGRLADYRRKRWS